LLQLKVFLNYALVLEAKHLKKVTLFESRLHHMRVLDLCPHVPALQNLFFVSYPDWTLWAVLLLNGTKHIRYGGDE
jgi:hypothetical protein